MFNPSLHHPCGEKPVGLVANHSCKLDGEPQEDKMALVIGMFQIDSRGLRGCSQNNVAGNIVVLCAMAAANYLEGLGKLSLSRSSFTCP